MLLPGFNIMGSYIMYTIQVDTVNTQMKCRCNEYLLNSDTYNIICSSILVKSDKFIPVAD